MKSTMKKCTCFVAAALAVAFGGIGLTPKKASADEASERRYHDAPMISTCASAGDYEDIYFARKEVTYVGTPNNVPYYYSNTLSNACGAVAGGIVVGYYDKYFQELIPGYTNYYTATGKYRPQNDTYIVPMMAELYDLMQINVVAPGVSESECLDGLEAFVEEQGYSIDYTAVMPYGSSFDHEDYQDAVSAGEPVLLFCDSVTLCEIFIRDTNDRVSVSQVSQDHIVVGFGYQIVQYYDENDNNFRTDTYLKVASGWNPNNMGYLKINDDNWLDSAFAVDIY